MLEICTHALGKLEAAVAGEKEKRKRKENTCRTIEDGLGSAFDSK